MFPVQSNHHVVGIPIFRHALLERSQTCTPSNGRESLGAERTWTSALPVPRTSLRYLEVKVIEHGWEIPHKCHKIGIQMGESSKENRGLSRSFHVFPLPEKKLSVRTSKEPVRSPFGQEPVLHATPEPSAPLMPVDPVCLLYPVDPRIGSCLENPDHFGR